MDLGLLLGFLGLLIVVVGFSIMIAAIYNRFQQLKNGAEATLSQIKVALKKRLDMINELLESVQSYARFEKETLEKIVEMRSKVLKVSGVEDLREIERDETDFGKHPCNG